MRHIVHIITRLDRGGSTEDVLLAAALRDRGAYACTVVHGPTEHPATGLMNDARAAGTHFIEVPGLCRAVRPVRDLRALMRLTALLWRLRPDIVHTHTSKAGVLGRCAALLVRCGGRPLPVLHATHGHVFYGYQGKVLSWLFVLIERAAARFTDRIAVLTTVERDEHLARGIGAVRQYAVVPSGISYGPRPGDPAALRERLGLTTGMLLIVAAGRCEPVKGFGTLIAAARLLPADGRWAFAVVGDGPLRPALERAARALPHPVRFPGWVDAVDEWIAAADIYVQPSRNEGLGKTVLTAQLLARPAIAARVQGLRAVIDDGVTGILVPPDDPAALAAALARLAADPALRDRLGTAARTAVNAIDPSTGFRAYSLEEMVALNERIYRTL